MRILLALAIALPLSFQPTLSDAGGPVGGSPSYCVAFEHANELLSSEDINVMRDEVEQRYLHARDVSGARSTVYSQTPLFVWANEAKISCAKAFGYLKRRAVWRPVVEEETIQKCECFYARMTSYLR